MNIFITAIGTDSGKSLVSAVFTEALQADYWKPVQAGYPRDTEYVQNLVNNSQSRFHEESYLLQSPMSPHAAAEIDGVQIKLSEITLPKTENSLIVEGAGGILVPLNDQDFVIDIAAQLDIPIVLVSNLYLGNINHTLLSVEALKRRNLEVLGIVFNGEPNPASEKIILHHTNWPCLLRIPQLEKINQDTVKQLSDKLQCPF